MKKTIISLVLIILANIAYSQEEDKLLVSEIKQSTVITQPATLNKGFFLVGASFMHIMADKMFSDKGKKDYAVQNLSLRNSAAYLSFHFGLTNRIELAFDLPYTIASISKSIISEIPLLDTAVTTKFKLKGKGIGDIEFGISYQLIEGSKTKPSLVSKLSAVFPTGEKNPTNIKGLWEYDYPTGRGETALRLELIYRKISYPYSYSFHSLFKYSFGGEKVMAPYEDPISFRSGNYYEVGGNFDFLLNDWIAVQNNLGFLYKNADKYNGETAQIPVTQMAIFYYPNINFQFKKFRLAQGVCIYLFGKTIPGDPQYQIDLQYIF
jgi:hypothetical protein